MDVQLLLGDCVERLRELPDSSVDACVTDPPYGLSKEPDIAEVLRHWLAGDDYKHSGNGFMGKEWDSFVPGPAVWREVYRVLKPGGYLLCFAGSRTYDLMAMSIRLAGFEIRDQMQWLYGSGFPKSLDVSKAIDKQPRPGAVAAEEEFRTWLKDSRRSAGVSVAEIKERVGFTGNMWGHFTCRSQFQFPTLEMWPKLKAAIALDDSFDFLYEGLVRPDDRPVIGSKRSGIAKAFSGDGTWGNGTDEVSITEAVTDEAKKWEGWGTALKPAHEPIVVARKPLGEGTVAANVLKHGTGAINVDECRVSAGADYHELEVTQGGKAGGGFDVGSSDGTRNTKFVPADGRWPANVILDEEAGRLLDEQSGVTSTTGKRTARSQEAEVEGTAWGTNNHKSREYPGDTGGASRFFYTAKTSKRERNAGLPEGMTNNHPTVKPIALMRYLIRLVTPPGGTLLDPFTGSGSTGCAAALERCVSEVIGVELEQPSLDIAQARISHWQREAEKAATVKADAHDEAAA